MGYNMCSPFTIRLTRHHSSARYKSKHLFLSFAYEDGKNNDSAVLLELMGVGAYFSARIYQNAIAISFDFDFELSWLGEGWSRKLKFVSLSSSPRSSPGTVYIRCVKSMISYV